MRFDWYECSIDAEIGEVAAVLGDGEELVDFVPVRPRMGYARGVEVRRGDYVLATALWGGKNAGVHVVGTGPAAVRLAEKMREAYPGHSVTRADVCEDFQGQATFERMVPLLLTLADEFKLSVRHVGDWHRAEKGRTLYLGSGASPVQVRVYEKGRKEGPPANPDWVRVEIQVRPKGRVQKRVWASVTPAGAWGASRWAACLAERVLGVEEIAAGVRVGTEYQKTDRERKEYWLARQYLGLIKEWVEELGSPEEVGRYLVALAERVREEMRVAA